MKKDIKSAEPPVKKNKSRLAIWLVVMGPGLIVMLADTDAGSLITSAQMGAEFGYKLLIQTLILIPILFMAQELTVRLGLATGQGHGELIKHHFGKFWAWVSVSTLLITCVGAMITEFIGINGVGHLFGVSSAWSMGLAALFLLLIAWTGSYRSVERIAIFLGLFELAFLVVAYKSHPVWHDIWRDAITFPPNKKEYLFLTAANIGAVIMPWMIFYQQSAVVDKKLTIKHLKQARIDTGIGAVITQCIMGSVLIAVAATIGKSSHAPLNSVEQISQSLTPFLGIGVGKIVFAIGMTGACMVAAIVVTCTAAWGLGEVLGYRRSLSDHPKQAPWFYLVYTAVILISSAFVAWPVVNLVRFNVSIEVMNALLLPIVLGFLYLLGVKALPEKYRLSGKYKWFCLLVLGGSALFGLLAGILGS